MVAAIRWSSCIVGWLIAAKSLKPKATLLSDMLKEYLAIRDISERPVRLAVDALESVSGDREISDYKCGHAQRKGHHDQCDLAKVFAL